MAHADSGSRDALARVDDPTVAKLLMDDAYRSVLGAFLGHDRSAGDAARSLGRDLDATLYRVKRLLRHGLLVRVGQRRRAGRPIAVYRSAHERWFVPFHALPYADLEETFRGLHVEHAHALARAAARALHGADWAGYRIERGADGQLWMHGVRDDGTPFAPGDLVATDAAVELHLTPDDARALGAELTALVQRYTGRSRSGDDAPANHLLVVASVPLLR